MASKKKKKSYRKLVLITPELAKKWLSNKRPARHLSESIVETYCREIKTGHFFEDSPGGISFDTKSRLADGQHRLTAIVRTGVSVRMWVNYNVSEDVIKYALDAGKIRTLTDRLNLEGEKFSSKKSALVRHVICAEYGDRSRISLEMYHTVAKKIGFEVIDEISQASKLRVPAGLMAALALTFPLNSIRIRRLIRILLAQEAQPGPEQAIANLTTKVSGRHACELTRLFLAMVSHYLKKKKTTRFNGKSVDGWDEVMAMRKTKKLGTAFLSTVS